MLSSRGNRWFARKSAATRAVALLVFCLGLLALAAACGDGGDGGDGGEDGTVAVETPAADATIGPAPTYDPTTPLVEYHSEERGYSVRYPEGWEVEPGGGSGPGNDMFFWRIDSRRVALLQVTCNPDFLTTDELMRADSGVVSSFGGTYSVSSAVPVEVAGREGMRNMYALTLGGLRVEHVVVYLPGDECGWRIGLSSFGEGTRDQFISLFDEIIESFRFD